MKRCARVSSFYFYGFSCRKDVLPFGVLLLPLFVGGVILTEAGIFSPVDGLVLVGTVGH